MSTEYGKTSSGKPVTDELIEDLAREAEQGYEVDTIMARRGRRGRPALGDGASSVESVRLDPQMKRQLEDRATKDGVSVSHVIREALDQHLRAG